MFVRSHESPLTSGRILTELDVPSQAPCRGSQVGIISQCLTFYIYECCLCVWIVISQVRWSGNVVHVSHSCHRSDRPIAPGRFAVGEIAVHIDVSIFESTREMVVVARVVGVNRVNAIGNLTVFGSNAHCQGLSLCGTYHESHTRVGKDGLRAPPFTSVVETVCAYVINVHGVLRCHLTERRGGDYPIRSRNVQTRHCCKKHQGQIA